MTVSVVLVFAVTRRDRAPEAARARPQPGVLYLFAVLPGRRRLGAPVLALRLGREHAGLQLLLPAAAATHSRSTDSRNWFALAVFLVTAVVVSELAAGLRRRATGVGAAGGDRARRCSRAASLERRSSTDRRRGRAGAAGRPGDDHDRLGRRARRTARTRSSPATRRVGLDRRSKASTPGTRRGAAAAPARARLARRGRGRPRAAAREAVEAEALRRSDALKTAVLRAVSHDLRTPLMAILTSASALSRRDLDARAERPRRAARRRSSPRPSASTGWSATCSTSRACRQARSQPSPRRGRSTTSSSQALGRGRVRGRRGSRSRCPTSPPIARVDAQQVERALVNLIENALKYSPADEPVRVLSRAPTARTASSASIDHGPGIARRRGRADLRAVPPRAKRRLGSRRRASGWRSRAASPRRAAGASGSSRGTARARPSRSSSRSPRPCRERAAHSRRRRRAADPARAADEPPCRRLRGRDR